MTPDQIPDIAVDTAADTVTLSGALRWTNVRDGIFLAREVTPYVITLPFSGTPFDPSYAIPELPNGQLEIGDGAAVVLGDPKTTAETDSATGLRFGLVAAPPEQTPEGLSSYALLIEQFTRTYAPGKLDGDQTFQFLIGFDAAFAAISGVTAAMQVRTPVISSGSSIVDPFISTDLSTDELYRGDNAFAATDVDAAVAAASGVTGDGATDSGSVNEGVGETPPVVEEPGGIDIEIPEIDEPSVAGATEGPDRLTGTPGEDAIAALGGSDTVKGLDGADDIDLGAGDDIALSGGGNDTIRGGAGDDTIKSGAGDDLIDGGDGNDVILSGDGNDTILGGAGNDVIKPGRGDDQMDGGAGDDILVGFRGDEVLVGGAGNDTLLGNLDDDTITGGAGDDRMQGGPGRDVFVFDTPEWGHDRIVLDFLPQSDTLDFRGSGLALADLSITQAGDNVLIEAGDSSILINSARFGALDVADFAGDVLLFG
ncbi:calcium-binding protein [Rubrimonas cliftonensis]|uniref:Hemolysin-type calcium-binding repeat-containing protein n=1 Tax=Rubrimonas cliftonensis TaxID=89524 RepID=A0A1H4CSS4_9RHOB|nr:calcium-binding protein [Rubrimonas cliftonensis]SEA63349.1 Hemolysin-type calcium-binding repeat-containing protein [Rubrimonas cliftonensis]